MKRAFACQCVLVASLLWGMPSVAVANNTKLSSQIFVNFSNLQIDDHQAATEGWQPDLKRFYLDLDHGWSDQWKLKVTTDVQWHRQQDPTDVWFRHAYIAYQMDKHNQFKLGVAELPWIDYAARRVGYRYIDPSLNPKNKLAAPTDLGLHYGFTNQDFSFAVSAITGGGFQKPRVGDQVDIELAAVWHISNAVDLATGWYEGTRTQDKDENPKYHVAQRWNIALSYQLKGTRVGIEYAYNDNWMQVNKMEEDASDGWSIWASNRLLPDYSVFVRYDWVHPSRRLSPDLERDYFQVGLDWNATNFLTIAFVAKQSHVDSLVIEQEQNEIGIWTMWNF
ncbi:hypothetical protein LG272_04465 [Pseudidiomarina marina]|uniref:hypothetical protein n=1 Tax=Pseudidiomarina marina TaxID=502366 RepID=UPI00384D96FE